MILYQCPHCGEAYPAAAWNESTQEICHGSITPLVEEIGGCWFACPSCGSRIPDSLIIRIRDKEYYNKIRAFLQEVQSSPTLPCPLTHGLVENCGDASCKECWITLLTRFKKIRAEV